MTTPDSSGRNQTYRGCPLRECWQLAAHQQLSPGWQQQLAFSLTVTTSYEGAAALLRQLGHRADDATLHALAQTLGARAEAQTQRRLGQPVEQPRPPRAASQVGVLMLDGWQVRQRGPGWGRKQTKQPRVVWHELKTGVFYLQEQAVRKNGRGILSDKVVVSWQGEPIHPEGAPIPFKTTGPFYVGIGFTSHLPANVLTAKVSDVVMENRAGRVR